MYKHPFSLVILKVNFMIERMALIFPPSISAKTEIATLLTLSLTAFFFFLLINLKRKQGKGPQGLPLPPGPQGLPIFGSLPFLKPNLHKYFASLARSYGPVLSLRLGSKLYVVISSPSTAREIFKDQDATFANRVIPATALFYYGGFKPEMLWAPYDTHWRMVRKIAVQEMLCVASIEALAPLRRREMRRTIEVVLARAKMGVAVDVREITFMTMLNMMTSMLWGEPVDSDGEGKKFKLVIEAVIDLYLTPNIADFFPMVAPLDPQGLGRRMKKLMEWIKKYLEEVVEKKKQKMVSGERRRDVLEALMDLVETGNPQVPFTYDDLYKLLLDLIEASTDTTSSTVEWSMAQLLNNPKKMQIAQQELDAIVGKHRIVEEFDIPHLHYLCAVVKESLRLHPPAPLLVPRCPSSHSVIGGFFVPAGSTVLINVWAIQRDPHLWGEDAEEFKPERFLKIGKENRHLYLDGNDQFCYLPFGAGRRVCPGTAMGEKMIIYMLASLLHSYDWQLPEGASLQFGEKLVTVLRKEEQLVAVPTMRLDKLELYA